MDNAVTNKLKLPDFVYSHEQIGLYLLQLDHERTLLLKKEAQSNSELGATSEKRGAISAELQRYLVSVSENGNITYDVLDNVYKFLKEIQETAPRLHMTTAALASEKFKRSTVSWLRQNIAEFLLVSFRYDKSLVGGAVIRTRNKIFDLSYSKKLLDPKVKISNILESLK